MIEAPPAPTQEAPVQQSAPPSFDAAIAAQQEHLNQRGQNAPPKQQEAPKKSSPDAGIEKPKSEPSKPKSPFDKLDSLKIKEPAVSNEVKAPEEAGGDEPPTPDPKAKAQEKFGEYKKEALEYRERRKEWEAKEKRLQELESQWTPDKVKQYEELQKFQAAKAIEETPEYQKQILEPWVEREQRVKQAADEYKVDFNQLWKVMREETNVFSRNKKISQMFKEAAAAHETDVEPGDLARVQSIAEDLDQLVAKDAEHRRNAVEEWSAIQGKKTAETEAQKSKQSAEYQKAHDEVYENLSKRQLFGADFDMDVGGEKISAAELVKSARPAEDAMGRAFQAQAAELAPFLVNKINVLTAELAELKKTNTARIAAKPNLSNSQGAPPDKPTMSFDDAINATRRKQGIFN